MVLETARKFGLDVCAPTAAARDQSGAFPEAELKALAELGFMGVKVPVEHGGAGLDMVSYALAGWAILVFFYGQVMGLLFHPSYLTIWLQGVLPSGFPDWLII